MNKNQKIYACIAAALVVGGLVASNTYRPYVYQQQRNDFGLADTIGSLVSVMAFCCLMWAIKEYSFKQKRYHILGATLLYGLLWELAGLWGIHGTFDWKDMVAAFVSGLATYALLFALEGKRATKSIVPETV